MHYNLLTATFVPLLATKWMAVSGSTTSFILKLRLQVAYGSKWNETLHNRGVGSEINKLDRESELFSQTAWLLKESSPIIIICCCSWLRSQHSPKFSPLNTMHFGRWILLICIIEIPHTWCSMCQINIIRLQVKCPQLHASLQLETQKQKLICTFFFILSFGDLY